jgi:hypothetical protein
MKVKKISKEKIDKMITYPFLGESILTGNIILFTAAEQGIVLELGDNNDIYRMGQCCLGLDMKCFKKYEGKLVLEND